MKKIISLILSAALLFLLAFSMVSCGEQEDETLPPLTSSDTIVLSVYNWGEYISDGSEGCFNTNKAFEKYCREKLGLKVEVLYTTYANNEEMYSKVTSEAGIYDVIFPSDYVIERLIAEDWLYPINASTNEILKDNFAYIHEDFKGENCFYDPNNIYSVPYTYGMVGVIYNSRLMNSEDLDENGEIKDKSWSLLWNENYAGKILQFNNPRDAFGTAMYYKNIDVNSSNAEDWQTALDILKEQKPLLQAYVNDEIFDKMTTESSAVSTYYAGDYITMYNELTDYGENEENDFLKFFYPKEGTNVFVDAMCIPKNARHPELAMEYINFMLSVDPEAESALDTPAVANAIYIGYASPNMLVQENEEYIEEMGEYAMSILYEYSPLEANENYDYSPYFRNLNSIVITDGDGNEANAQTYLNNFWERLKTWSAVEPWIHIVSIAIVVGVLGMCCYGIYVKKKRSRHYRYRDREAKPNRG